MVVAITFFVLAGRMAPIQGSLSVGDLVSRLSEMTGEKHSVTTELAKN